jgi:hypothetical protein
MHPSPRCNVGSVDSVGSVGNVGSIRKRGCRVSLDLVGCVVLLPKLDAADRLKGRKLLAKAFNLAWPCR